MSAPPKPGIDWTEIERRYRLGESANALAKEFPVTRQAIEKRVRRQGWPRDETAIKLSQSLTTSRMQHPVTQSDRLLARAGKRTPENGAKVLELLRYGVPLATAGRIVGVSDDCLRGWIAEDADFAALVEAARHEAVAKRVVRLDQAGERGDWRADAWFLERAPLSRGEFVVQSDKTPVDIQFILNVPRDTDDKTEENTIDVTPDKRSDPKS